ncbi:MAG: hypothetical protein JOY82_19610 [Streptosporangiaceae bacterium]|nr:hypothetical protein [Streptosporangiaceae bacterium]MBV9856694.1 hypothetical protein [Streptosporangiaceae bacterium]
MREYRWTAVVAAVAGAVAALVALVAYLWPRPGGGAASTPAASTTAGTQRAVIPGGSPANAAHPMRSAASSPPADVVRWHGTVGIDYHGVYLDDTPPSTAVVETGDIAFYSYYLSMDEFSDNGSGPGTLSRWYGSSRPTPQQCSNLIYSHPQTEVGNIHPGVNICVRTAHNRIAYVHIITIYNAVAQLDVTVWELP